MNMQKPKATQAEIQADIFAQAKKQNELDKIEEQRIAAMAEDLEFEKLFDNDYPDE